MKRVFKTLPVASLLGSIFALACTDLHDYDLWFHLAYGRELLKLGHFPETEIFMAAVPGVSMANPEWLFDVVVNLLWSLAGPAGVVALKAALIAAVFAVMLRGSTVERRNLVIAVSVLFLAGLCWRPRFIERPELPALLLMSGAIYLLRTVGGRRPRAVIASLVVIQVVWVNVHASALLLPLIAALYLYPGFAIFLAGRRLGRTDSRTIPGALGLSGARVLLLVPPLLAAATLVNPFGWEVHAHFMAFSATTVYKHTISELMPLKLFKPGEPVLYFLVLWVAGCLAAWRRVNPADVILGGAFLYLARDSMRFLPFFVVAAAPAAASGLSAGFARLAEKRPAWFAGGAVRFAGVAALAAVTAAVPLFSAHASMRTNNARPGFGVFPYKFPQGCVSYLKSNGVKSNVLNTFHLGGYLEWEYYPDGKPMFDGRATQVPEALLTRLNLAEHDPAHWASLEAEFGFEAAVLENPLMKSRHAFLDEAYYANWQNPAPPGWAMVFWDDTCMAFVKRERFPAIAARDEYVAAMPVEHGRIDLAAGHGKAGGHASAMVRATQEKELWRNMASSPAAITPRIFLARLLHERKEPAEAIRVLSEVEPRINVRDANVVFGGAYYSLLGSLSLQENDAPRAVANLEKAVRSSPHNVEVAVSLGEAYLRAGRDADGERILRPVATADRLNQRAIRILRDHYRAKGLEEEAVNLDRRYESAARLSQAETHFVTATDLYKAKRYEEAIVEYRKSLEVIPGNVPTTTNIGWLNYDIGRTDEAIAWFSDALAIDPGWPEAHYGLGLAYEKSGRPDLSLAHFEKYLARTPRGYYSKKAEDKIAGLKAAIEKKGR